MPLSKFYHVLRNSFILDEEHMATPYRLDSYDIANRLTQVNGLTLTWDANGNLLQDHLGRVYTYDSADRLTSLVQGGSTFTFAYNGLGDRLQQTVNGVPTHYSLDLNNSLTQVLSDGSSAYLYGLDRIGESGEANRFRCHRGLLTWLKRFYQDDAVPLRR